MSAANVQKTCESTREKLKPAIDRIENFLNENALPELDQNQTEESTAFYKGFLSDLRHLLVFLKFLTKNLALCCVVPTLMSILPKRLFIIRITNA